MKFARAPLFLGLVFVALLVACSSTSAPPPSAGLTPIIPATTKVADPATREALIEYDADSGIMRFSARTQKLVELKPDDVLVSEPSAAAPYGYLRKVKAMRQEGDVIVLETAQASLTDAIHQGSLEFERELKPDDLLEPRTFVEGLSITPAADARAGFNFVANFDETILDINEGGVSSKVRVNGYLAFNVSAHLGLDIGGRVLPPDIYVQRFEASAGIAQKADLRISGEANAKFTKDVKVAEIPFATFCVPIAFVPVCFVPTIYMFVGASGEVNLRFDYQVVQTFDARVGAKYVRKRGWENIGHGPAFDISLVRQPSVNAQLKASGYTRAEIGLMLYGLAGPTFGAKLGVELDAAIPRDPLWTLSGFLEAYYGLVIDLPILGRIADHRATIFKISEEFTRSPNSPPVIVIKEPNMRTDLGNNVTFHSSGSATCRSFSGAFCVYDLEDGTPEFTVTSDRDGPLSKWSHTFTTSGVRTITVRATDRRGATASASFRLDVVNTPPTAYGSADSDTVPATVALFINANATDPNSKLDCSALRWSVTAPDTIENLVYNNELCYGKAVFHVLGQRHVTLTAVDPEGAVSRPRTFDVYVTPAPPVPAPDVTRPLTAHACADEISCPALVDNATLKFYGNARSRDVYFRIEATSEEELTYRLTVQCLDCPAGSQYSQESLIQSNQSGFFQTSVNNYTWQFRGYVVSGSQSVHAGNVKLKIEHDLGLR